MDKQYKFLGEYEELAPGHGFPTMNISISNEPVEGKGKVIYYLRHGNQNMYSMKKEPVKDVFTGKIIHEAWQWLTDGEYVWPEYLAYYVEHYNLRLPRSFEEKAIRTNIK